MKTILTTLLVGLLWLGIACATVLHVPGNFATIGAAIQAAVNGDSIIVGPGIYDQVPFSITGTPQNITLLGNGYMGPNRTVIIGSGTVPQAKIDLINVNGWEVGGFEMILSNKGVSADGCQGVHLHDLYIHDLSWNYADGIGLDENTDVTIERCIISNTPYSGVNLWYNGNGNVTIRNNTFTSTPNGILVLGNVPNLILENNIMTSCGDGVEFDGFWTPTLVLDYNDAFANDNNWSGCTPGSHNISANAQFVGGSGAGQYMLQPNSPCIDTGDPNSPLDPDGTRADIGCFWFNHGSPGGHVSLDLQPLNPPIVVPAQGGSFSTIAIVHCDTAGWALTDAWASLRDPFGQIVPLFNRLNLHLNSGQTLLRLLQTYVSPSAAPGTYWYRGFLGDYPNLVTSADSFSFVKTEANDPIPPGQKAYLTIIGWDDPVQVDLPAASALPQEMALAASPNPFNPKTDIRYKIQDARFVNLKVYNTAGRLVATLVDGRREAGDHQITFDGSKLASGIYLAVLETGGQRLTQRLLLMK